MATPSRFKVAASATPTAMTGLNGSVVVRLNPKPRTVSTPRRRQMTDSNGLPVWIMEDTNLKASKTQPVGSIKRMETVNEDVPVTRDGKAVMDNGSVNLSISVVDEKGHRIDGGRIPQVTLDTLSVESQALWEAAFEATRNEVLAGFSDLEVKEN